MFEPLSFDQNNPVLTGASRMSQLIQQGLMNQQLRMQNQVMPQSLQEQLQSARLQNALSQNNLNFAPQNSQANLDSTRANTDLTKATIPYVGLRYLSGYNNSAAKLMGAGTGNANSFRAWSQTPEGQKIISTNPQLAETIFNSMKKQSEVINSGYGLPDGAGPQMPMPNQQQMPPPQGGAQQPNQGYAFSPDEIKKLKQVLQSGGGASANAQAANPNQSNIDAIQGAAADAYSKKIDTNQVRNQRVYANVLDGMFEEGNKMLPSVSQYASALGRVKFKAERLAASAGHNSQGYSDYQNFTRNIVPIQANEMRRTLGGQATDHEQKLMDSISNPLTWDSNPDLAIKQYKSLQDIFKNRVNPALTLGPAQTKQKLMNSGNQAPQQNSPALNLPPPPAGTVNIVDPNGGYHNIPKMSLSEALKRGAKQVQ